MKKPVNRLKRSENIWGWTFVAPTPFAFLALTALPFVISILLSFVDWNFFSGVEKIKWVGLQHFVDMWDDDKFVQGLKNTFVYVIGIVPLSIILSLVFAYCMNGRIFGKMGHSERVGSGLYRNVPGNYDIRMFEAAVRYFR